MVFEDGLKGASEEEMRDIARLWWEKYMPKQYVSLLNIPEFRKTAAAVDCIRKYIDASLRKFNECAIYKLEFDPILGTNMLFTAVIPDIGFKMRKNNVDDIMKLMPSDYLLSVCVLADGNIELGFTFYNVKNLIAAE